MSLTMFLTETAVFSIGGTNGLRKGFPLTAYLENWVILAQVMVICILMCHYSNRTATAFLYVVATAASLAALQTIPQAYVEWLMSAAIGLTVYGRLPQIWSNWKRQDTGALSLATFGLSFAGGLARIFTTLQEAPSTMLLAGFITAVTLNGAIMLQILVYGGGANKGRKTKGTKQA